MQLTLTEGETSHELEAVREDGAIRIPAEGLRECLGWELKPEGLCRDAVCIPVRDRDALVREAGLDLETLAALLDRPLALDAEEGIAVLGESAGARGARLESLEAPDFSLPDLDGTLHSLSEHRGKKVLLIAYASW
jgi:hypothetical protein